MSYTIENIFSLVGSSVMLLNDRGTIEWISEDENGVKKMTNIDLAEFVLRSIAYKLIDDGNNPEEVRKIAYIYGIDLYDDSPYWSVKFGRLN